ncbi:MAG: MATE family efflux transporter [Rikenellaceae bacterium]
MFKSQMNRRIIALTIPNIISNITVPLLGMVDLAIVGRLGGATSIGAIAIGTAIFNLIYWNFGFLRMGTSGLTAQAFGRRSFSESINMLTRSMVIGLLIASVLLLFQKPILVFANMFMGSSLELQDVVAQYFFVRIWGAPATLAMYVFKGWFIGMQNSKTPMWISIQINVVNIVLSYLFAFNMGMGIGGVALGTILAQYSGCVTSMLIILTRYKVVTRYFHFKGSLRMTEMKKFFKINTDILLRTICLSFVFASFTAFSTHLGEDTLAVNTVLLQLFTLFSYIMDGFAFAGEALTGKYYGAGSRPLLKEAIRYVLIWGVIISTFFTILYTFLLTPLISIFTNVESIITLAGEYKWWVVAIPFAGFLAFVLDGVLIGITQTKIMRNSIFFASIIFYAVYYLLTPTIGNNAIWLAFILYLIGRGVIQYIYYKRIDRVC